MTAQNAYAVIPGFENYEINRGGTIRRRIRGSIKNTAPVGKPIRGGQGGTAIRLEQDGKKFPTTRRALLAKVFGPDAVPRWRYHILTHPELKIHKGESNGNHVLTAQEVLDLREWYASGGWSHRKLAAEFGIARATVHKILSRQTWTHL